MNNVVDTIAKVDLNLYKRQQKIIEDIKKENKFPDGMRYHKPTRRAFQNMLFKFLQEEPIKITIKLNNLPGKGKPKYEGKIGRRKYSGLI